MMVRREKLDGCVLADPPCAMDGRSRETGDSAAPPRPQECRDGLAVERWWRISRRVHAGEHFAVAPAQLTRRELVALQGLAAEEDGFHTRTMVAGTDCQRV
jgi:hypothetical protein